MKTESKMLMKKFFGNSNIIFYLARIFGVLSFGYGWFYGLNYDKPVIPNPETGQIVKLNIKNGVTFYVTRLEFNLYYGSLAVGLLLLLSSVYLNRRKVK
jgi:hypothetical protein